MTNPQLPAYLQNRQSRIVSDGAADGIGGALPPHVSIRGNVWTLVDANGNKQPLTEVLRNAQGQEQIVALDHLDGVFIDRSDVVCKQYYENDFEPDSNDPPTCWSANGVAPSVEAAQPQSATCASCQWNIRGSDTSRLSGKPIKACRDEKWTAFISVKYSAMIFQFKITPGSFKAWKGYVDKFKGQQTDLSDVVTRCKFEAGKNGVMTFQALSYIDQVWDERQQAWIDRLDGKHPLYDAREQAAIEKKTDVLVGRNDRPISAALAPPRQEAGQAPLSPPGSLAPIAPFAGGAEAARPTFAPTQTIPNPGAFPSDPTPTRRRRRTKAEIEADARAANPAGAGQAPIQGSQFGGGNAGPAPFRPVEPPTTGIPGGQAPQFGIAQTAVAPDPAMKGMLDSIFGKPI
jgi:hypothetical protein